MAKRERAAWEVEADTARLLVLLAQAQQHHLLQQQRAHAQHALPPLFPAERAAHGRVFECKTCSRQFPTFQALGGHRASHKRPRVLPQQQQPAVVADHAEAPELCLGRQLQLQLPLTPTTTPTQPAKPRVHECPVCGLEFAIGQALGGHMRRHRGEADADADAGDDAEAPTGNKPLVRPLPDRACDVAGGICLDLNLTPSENCAKCRRSVVVLGAAGAGQGVRHNTLAVLDCSL